MSRLALFAIAIVLVFWAATSMVSLAEAGDQNDLAPPFAVLGGGVPLDRPLDNAFPWLRDCDGDGRPDLPWLPGRSEGNVPCPSALNFYSF